MSIRTKLILLFLAIGLFPALVISVLTFQNYKASLESSHITALQNVAAYKASRIDTCFLDLKNHLEVAQNLYSIKNNLPTLSRLYSRPNDPAYIASKSLLDNQLNKMQVVMGVHDFMLASPQGKVVYASDVPYYNLNFRDALRDIQQKVFENGKNGIYFSDIFPDKEKEGDYAMLISGPAKDLKGHFIGVIIFSVDMDDIYRLVQDVTGMGKSGETLLGKLYGDEVIYLNPLRNDPQAALKRRVKIGDKVGVPMQNAVQGKAGSGEYLDYRGHRVIASWRLIPTVNWGMVAKVDVAEAFAEVSKLRNIVMAIVFGVVALCVVSAFYFARSIAYPINRLSKGAEIIGNGNMDYLVGTSGKDEISGLSRAFDNMTRKLKATTASRDELNNEIKMRKHIEGELRRSNENLEQFAYVASHDLQEPLRMMASYSSLLEKRYKSKLDKDADEFISYIVDGAKRMQTLINDLLTYSRVGREEAIISAVNINTVLAGVKQSLAAAINESGAIITNDELPTVNGRESNFTHLFLNLIDNAIKFRGSEPPRIHISAYKKGLEWVFSVKDNGIGIESQYKDRIFLIFQRLHGRGAYSGTGIGLAICKKIAETEGGRIWVESNVGEGSNFCFTIPA